MYRHSLPCFNQRSLLLCRCKWHHASPLLPTSLLHTSQITCKSVHSELKLLTTDVLETDSLPRSREWKDHRYAPLPTWTPSEHLLLSHLPRSDSWFVCVECSSAFEPIRAVLVREFVQVRSGCELCSGELVCGIILGRIVTIEVHRIDAQWHEGYEDQRPW